MVEGPLRQPRYARLPPPHPRLRGDREEGELRAFVPVPLRRQGLSISQVLRQREETE